ncbi:Uncharacterised protein [Candidatus Tiddalikarchaeum anstoanum]|nr:Uncharacterised protein [Candidatus Tiddalikarchaeum anstoanum]
MNVYDYVNKVVYYIDSMPPKELAQFCEEFKKREHLGNDEKLKWLVNYMKDHGVTGNNNEIQSPLEVLKLRLAKGEISKTEYLEIKKELEK